MGTSSRSAIEDWLLYDLAEFNLRMLSGFGPSLSERRSMYRKYLVKSPLGGSQNISTWFVPACLTIPERGFSGPYGTRFVTILWPFIRDLPEILCSRILHGVNEYYTGSSSQLRKLMIKRLGVGVLPLWLLLLPLFSLSVVCHFTGPVSRYYTSNFSIKDGQQCPFEFHRITKEPKPPC